MTASRWMQLALLRAESVRGRTSPNPPVGAVIVRDDTIVGAGATEPPGGPHAEIVALEEAGPLANGATLYTTLEPCCHHGRTPPCTDAILAAGVSRVVAACQDPNPLVSGEGLRRLRLAGIEAEEGDGREEAGRQLMPFFSWITRGRPHVTAKWAMTLDGKLATRTGDSRWISGEESRAWVHDLRDATDAILVGSGTALLDDPRLTVRRRPGDGFLVRSPRPKGPLRVVVDGRRSVPSTARLLSPELASGTLLVTQELDRHGDLSASSRLEVLTLPAGTGSYGVDLPLLMGALAARGVTSLLVEGGAGIFGNLFDAGLVDHVAAFVAPVVAGGSDARSPVGGRGVDVMTHATRLSNLTHKVFGPDVLFEGDVEISRLAQGVEAPIA